MFLCLVLFNFVINQLAGASPVSSDSDAMFYLASFGYLDPALKNNTNSVVSRDTFRRAVSDFQSFAGLNPTGVLDEETKTWMSKPRCGVPDIIREGSSTRRKRDADIKIWKKKHLTYRILKYTKHMEQSVVDREIARAFQVWADVTQLTFSVGQKEKFDIKILFESRDHDDSQPFDGPGGTLAHALFPPRGDTHFDDDETWTINSISSADLFQVATHEFGHALGLDHTTFKTAVMWPTFEYVQDFRLQIDDIERIQKLYGQTEMLTSASTLETLEKELKATKKELADAKQELRENLAKEMNAFREVVQKEFANTKSIVDDLKKKLKEPGYGDTPSSCEDLEEMGHKLNGFFIVKGSKKMNIVFCDFHHYRNKLVGFVEVKTTPVHFYVQRTSKSDKAGYRISYQVAQINEGNAMDLTSGKFTAPRTGTYFFAFTALALLPPNSTDATIDVGLYLNKEAPLYNGKQMGKSKLFMTTAFDGAVLSPLTLQSTLHLEKGNEVWVELDSLDQGAVLYEKFTVLTGFILEEELDLSLVTFYTKN